VMAALRLAGFAERRVNGLAAAPNETEGLEASLRLAREGAAAAPSWLLVVYGQAREFSQVFAAVDEARASARPVLDQFDVPARAAGLRGDMRLPWGGGHATRLSIDARWAQGETNERFRDLGDGFTRLRRAGGAQLIAGLAVEESWTLARGLILTGGLRLDHWRNVNGIRQESDLATGALLVDEKSADQKGWRPSARLGAAMPLTPALTARLAAYSAFRVPTLNELHRPFRVRNDITEANPALRPEKLKGVEGGLDYAPLAGLEFTATLFANWLGDAVGNVTLATGPGVFPIAGFVPAGGSLRQRRNIDGVRVVGLELGGRAEFAGAWALEGSYVYNAARVTAALMAPDLVGTRLVQVPRHQGQMTLRWQPAGPLSALLRARAAGRQFDDDLNTRVLKGYGALDAALRWQVDAGVTLFANGENLTDSLIEAARDGDGLVTRTTPRSLTLGLRLRL
ncbi:MAG: TonB-dependent receptor, partial [Pseudomonadota bacterium]